MEKVIDILKRIRKDVDYETEKDLVSGKILDSIDVTMIITELETAFDIEIGMEYMEAENFDSAADIWNMIQRIQEG